MKIGLFFGSFNPIHHGHLIISQYFIDNTAIDQVWFVVSPHNPLKDKNILLPQEIRLQLVKEATYNNPRFSVSEIEYELPQPSYTIDTLSELKKLYSENHFIILLGTDSVETIDQWKNYKQLIAENEIYLYPRSDYNNFNWINLYNNIQVFQAPLIDISSTYIRSLVLSSKSIQYLVPENVFRFYSLLEGK